MPASAFHALEDTFLNSVEQVLRDAANAADKVTLPLFRNLDNVDNKLASGFDPVTIADQNAELAIREVITRTFPDHNIVGEEHENAENGSAFTWTIDPIDGTRAFISGLPVWGTLIGLSYEGKNIAGIMSQPYIGEQFIGMPTKTRLMNRHAEQVVHTSTVTALNDAIIFTTTPALFEGEKMEQYRRVEQSVKLARYGCDCYAYCLLAAGQIDLVIEPGLNSYDIAALIPIIENAGGIVTTFDGKPADLGGDVIAAATQQLHEAAMSLYNG